MGCHLGFVRAAPQPAENRQGPGIDMSVVAESEGKATLFCSLEDVIETMLTEDIFDEEDLEKGSAAWPFGRAISRRIQSKRADDQSGVSAWLLIWLVPAKGQATGAASRLLYSILSRCERCMPGCIQWSWGPWMRCSEVHRATAPSRHGSHESAAKSGIE